jgi:hypothetical protein
MSPYRAGIPYVVAGYGLGPYFPGYPDYGGSDDSAATPGNASDDASGGYDAEPPDQGQLGPYQPTSDMTRPAPVPPSEEAVTLIFKDGRPPEQIHNYLMTRTTLYVGDQHHNAIPMDELDLVATAKVNQDAGVEFQLPNASR